MESFVKNYYFIFEAGGEIKDAEKEDDALELLNKRARDIAANFRELGNSAKAYEGDGADRDLAELLYNHYNPKTKERESFYERTLRIRDDRRIVKEHFPDEEIPFDIKNLIAPKSIDLNDSPSYVLIDGMYRSLFYFARKNSPLVYGNGRRMALCSPFLRLWL